MTNWKRRFVDFIGRLGGIQIARNGSAWVLVEREQLRRFLTTFQVDCVFDVGANVGQYASELRYVGFKGLIVSFEPIPSAAAKIRKAAADDELWIVKEAALDSESRTVTFNVMRSSQFSSLHQPDHSGTAAFVDLNTVEQTLELQTQTLSDIFPALQAQYGFKRPFLKMDTQGNDINVTNGAGQFIRLFVGLQSELSMTPLYEKAPSYYEALCHYQGLGFKLSALIPNTEGHFPDLIEIDCLMYNPGFRPN